MDSRLTAWQTYIFIKSNFLFRKNWKQNKKISGTAVIIAVSKGTILFFMHKISSFYDNSNEF